MSYTEQGGPNRKPLLNIAEAYLIALKPANVNLKCPACSIILSLGIKYSMRELICDVNYCL